MSEAFNKQFELGSVETKVSNHRAAKTESAAPNTELKNQTSVYSKIQSQSSAADQSYTFQPQTRTGGAYYLPLVDGVKPEVVVQAVVSSWENLSNSDISSLNPEDVENFAAWGILYKNEKFMLARTKLCSLDEEKSQVYLEINKLEGDGFVFADDFKKTFVEPLVEAKYVTDVEEFEPLANEEDLDAGIEFLDFSADLESAMAFMQQLLGHLKPKGGVKYDAKKIYESVSTLGHNANNEKNLEFLIDYQEHIVNNVLEVLRHEEMNFIPSVYYGATLINTFLSSPKFDDDLKTWETFNSLVDALKRHCIGKGQALPGGQQVVRSRQSRTIIMSSLQKLAKMLQESETKLEDDMRTKILTGLDEETTKEMGELLA